MDIQASIEQVAGILFREDFKFSTHSDGRSYRLLFGSAGVFIHFKPWGDDSVVVTVSSPVLQGIDPDSPGMAEAMNLIGKLNRRYFFVKFSIFEDQLIADHDLLGDTLQAGELRNAIFAIAGAADHLDGELADRLGGKPFDVQLAEWEAEQEEPESE